MCCELAFPLFTWGNVAITCWRLKFEPVCCCQGCCFLICWRCHCYLFPQFPGIKSSPLLFGSFVLLRIPHCSGIKSSPLLCHCFVLLRIPQYNGIKSSPLSVYYLIAVAWRCPWLGRAPVPCKIQSSCWQCLSLLLHCCTRTGLWALVLSQTLLNVWTTVRRYVGLLYTYLHINMYVCLSVCLSVCMYVRTYV